MWEKLGLVFDVKKYKNLNWIDNSALTPQPILINQDTIRVFCGFRDKEGISRIGYVDISTNNLSEIKKISKSPVIDVGRDGCFDDNGLIMGDAIHTPDGIYIFYVGFQIVKKAKFLAFSGLALSTDNGETFHRMSDAPILDRGTNQNMIGAIHTVIYEDGIWKIWFAKGDDWEFIDGKPYPKYHICYTETKDILNIPKYSIECITPLASEYRIGRPKVSKLADNSYIMYATKGTKFGDYTPSLFRSVNGIDWKRDDSSTGIYLSESGWDSETLCYPALIKVKDTTVMFYNGNNMGYDGFGIAINKEIALK